MIDVNIRKYPNGFELRYANVPLNTIRGSVVAEVGAGYEQPQEYGISHFVEHTVIRGGTTQLSPQEATMITSKLGYANAGTTARETVYIGQFLPDDLDLYLRFVSDITHDAQFDPQIIEEERKGIIAERGKERNNPQSILLDGLYNAMFSKNPIRRNSNLAIIGPLENILAFGQSDLRQYHRRWTNRANSTLYLMGPLPSGIGDKVGGYFCQHDEAFKPFEYEKEPLPSGIKRDGITRKGAERTTVLMAWHVPPEEDYYNGIKLDMTAGVMGGDFTSGLLRELRIKRGLVYSAGARYMSLFGQGLYFVGTDVEPGKEKNAEEAILDFIDKFQKGEVDREFFERQQRRELFKQATAMDTPEHRFHMMQEEKRLGYDPLDKIKVINGLTVCDLQEASRHIDKGRYLFFTESPE